MCFWDLGGERERRQSHKRSSYERNISMDIVLHDELNNAIFLMYVMKVMGVENIGVLFRCASAYANNKVPVHRKQN